MRRNINYDLKIVDISRFSDDLEAFVKPIDEKSDSVTAYIESIKTVVKELKKNKGEIFKEIDEKYSNRIAGFFDSIKHAFSFKAFCGVCEFIDKNAEHDGVSFILERRFFAAIIELDLFLNLNRLNISASLTLINKDFVVSEVIGKLVTNEYSLLAESGVREALTPIFYFLTADEKTDSESSELDFMHSEVTAQDQSEKNSIEEFLTQKIKICSSYENKSFLTFLCEIAKNGLQNTSFDSLRKIEKWEQNCAEIAETFNEEEKSEFGDISNKLLRKLMDDGYLKNILAETEYDDFNCVVKRLTELSIDWSKATTLVNIESMDATLVDEGIDKLKMFSRVQERGYCFSNKAIKASSSYSNKDIIRYPKVVLSRPFLFKHLPNEIGDEIIILLYYRANNSHIAYSTLEQVKEFIANHKEFFSTLLACRYSFFAFLESEYGELVDSEQYKEWLYDELVKMCNKIGIHTPINLNMWVAQKEIEDVKGSKNPKIKSIKESRHHKYLFNEIAGYTDENPYMFTHAPVFFIGNYESKEIIVDKYQITEYLSRNELLKDNVLIESECANIEFMLDDEFISSYSDEEFENYLIENDVLTIFTNIYTKTEFKGRCCDFLIKKIFNIREYSLVNPIGDNSVLSETVPTDNKEKDGQLHCLRFGLMKGSELICEPKRCVYTFDPSMAFEKYLDLINEISSAGKPSVPTSLTRKIVESLIENMRILQTTNLVELDRQKKKNWVLRNDTISFLFDKEPLEDMMKLRDVLFAENLINKKEELERYIELFNEEWAKILKLLSEQGIKRIEIIPEVTIVSDKDLEKGWKVRNDRKEYTNNPDMDGLVYEIIQHGIEVEGLIAREPIVNVKRYNED